MSDRLDEYRAKRDFRRTNEPSGRQSPAGDGRQYVIHHHAASSEHYDLRLEHRGVLLSWAVPRGPSTDPREKRLAIRTEDHPLEYADFEGTIPDDEYGGGAVVVWDAGAWEPADLSDDEVDAALDDGHISFAISGEKLRGGYTLQRFRGDDQWLLVKHRDAEADARRNPTSTQPDSVRSGRTVEDVASGDGEPGDGDER